MTSTSRRYCSSSTVLSRNLLLEPEAGVVHQQVDRPRRVGQPGLDRGQLRPGRRGRRPAPRPRRRTSPRSSAASASSRSRVAGDQHQVVPRRGELVGEGQADAGGGAGDERRWVARHAAQHSTDRRSEPQHGLRHDGPVPASKTRILAVANQKGGVAKTTTVASLGAALAELGQRVLLVDLDPQACLTFSLGIDPEDLELSVHHVLTKGLDATEVIIADRRRRRPAARHHRAGPRRGRPAHPHRPRARREDGARGPRRTTGCCSTARRRWACSRSPR